MPDPHDPDFRRYHIAAEVYDNTVSLPVRDGDPQAANLLTILQHIALGETKPINFVVTDRSRGQEILDRLETLAQVLGWWAWQESDGFLALHFPEFEASVFIVVKPDAEE